MNKTTRVKSLKTDGKGSLTDSKNCKLSFHEPTGERLGFQKERRYGFLKARSSTSGYFQTKSGTLSPKIPSFTFMPKPEEHSKGLIPEPVLSFEMRRKRFDLGEFTICKGRKTSEFFHSADTVQQDLRRESLVSRTRADVKKLEDFCKENKIKIIKGHI